MSGGDDVDGGSSPFVDESLEALQRFSKGEREQVRIALNCRFRLHCNSYVHFIVMLIDLHCVRRVARGVATV